MENRQKICLWGAILTFLIFAPFLIQAKSIETKIVNKKVIGKTLPSPLSSSSLALDSKGRPHILYTENGYLRYAYKKGGDWLINKKFAGNNVLSPKIVIGTNDVKKAIYLKTDLENYGNNPCHLNYLKFPKKEARWTSIRLSGKAHVSDISECPFVDFDLDDKNNFHLAYFPVGKQEKSHLSYLYQADSLIKGFSVKSFSNFYFWSPIDFELDGAKKPHLVYSAPKKGGKVISYSFSSKNNKFETRAVEREKKVYVAAEQTPVAIALDGKNKAHLAYGLYKNGKNYIRYAAYDGSRFDKKTIDILDRPVFNLAIALFDDTPYVAYTSYRDDKKINKLILAKKEGSKFKKVVLDKQAVFIFYKNLDHASMSFDAMGGLHLVYEKSRNGESEIVYKKVKIK